MKQMALSQLYQRYPDEFVATSRKSGRLVAHAASMGTLCAQLKRKKIDLGKTIVEKVPPKNVAVIY